MDLPLDVLERATAVSEALAKNIKDRKKKSKAYIVSRRRKVVLALKETLVQAHEGNMDNDTLRSFLSQLQDEFVTQMDNLINDNKADENSQEAIYYNQDGAEMASNDNEAGSFTNAEGPEEF